jgi:indolepyruvate ferredoxin oxidoreductase, beta subunit
METNIILAGVGGQGILSISYVIDMASLKQGLSFKQSEVHGMSQRGGSVQSHLRVSDRTIYSDLVPKGRGTIVLSVEPLESLRYIEYLSPEGVVVSGVDPYINIENYPEVERVLDGVGALRNHTLVNADRLARQAGSGRAQNMVLLGAASPFLGIHDEHLEACIREAFAHKGEKVQRVNVDAFHMGKAGGAAYRACRAAGIGGRETRALTGRLDAGALQETAVPLWRQLFAGPVATPLCEALTAKDAGRVPGTPAVPTAILAQADPAPGRLKELLFATA